jgi:hypothetical protein
MLGRKLSEFNHFLGRVSGWLNPFNYINNHNRIYLASAVLIQQANASSFYTFLDTTMVDNSSKTLPWIYSLSCYPDHALTSFTSILSTNLSYVQEIDFSNFTSIYESGYDCLLGSYGQSGFGSHLCYMFQSFLNESAAPLYSNCTANFDITAANHWQEHTRDILRIANLTLANDCQWIATDTLILSSIITLGGVVFAVLGATAYICWIKDAIYHHEKDKSFRLALQNYNALTEALALQDGALLREINEIAEQNGMQLPPELLLSIHKQTLGATHHDMSADARLNKIIPAGKPGNFIRFFDTQTRQRHRRTAQLETLREIRDMQSDSVVIPLETLNESDNESTLLLDM